MSAQTRTWHRPTCPLPRLCLSPIDLRNSIDTQVSPLYDFHTTIRSESRADGQSERSAATTTLGRPVMMDEALPSAQNPHEPVRAVPDTAPPGFKRPPDPLRKTNPIQTHPTEPVQGPAVSPMPLSERAKQSQSHPPGQMRRAASIGRKRSYENGVRPVPPRKNKPNSGARAAPGAIRQQRGSSAHSRKQSQTWEGSGIWAKSNPAITDRVPAAARCDLAFGLDRGRMDTW